MNGKLCCFFNYNPLYRLPIYKEMDRIFGCDFYFGDTVFENIKAFDPTLLKGYKSTFATVQTGFKGYRWHKGACALFSRKYNVYILTGEINIIANWLILLWSKLTNRKVILWTHGEHTHYSRWTTRFLYSVYYRMADILLMYANYNWKYMIELGCKKEKLFTIHNSLDSDMQTEIYKSLSLSPIYHDHFGDDCPTIIYIGRLQKRKKLDLLLNAVRLLNSKRKFCNLVLVGGQTDEKTLESEVQKMGLEKAVWFYGESYDEKTNAELIYNACACVSPAVVGLTAIHALSYGCPVITNDDFEAQMPEHESIIDSVTGSFYATGDVEQLAEKIHFWCSLDMQQRMETRQNARKIIESEWNVHYQMNVLQQALRACSYK